MPTEIIFKNLPRRNYGATNSLTDSQYLPAINCFNIWYTEGERPANPALNVIVSSTI